MWLHEQQLAVGRCSNHSGDASNAAGGDLPLQRHQSVLAPVLVRYLPGYTLDVRCLDLDLQLQWVLQPAILGKIREGATFRWKKCVDA